METVTGPDEGAVDPDHELPAQFAGYELADRFRLEDGRVFLSGVQAVARLPVDQLRIDRRNGLNTAAFVSGYQGSPVGTLQEEVSRAARTVPDLPIVVRPGVNEELAATAVMGSQLADARPERKYDGVLGMWYGKAPGLDRASDAIRHAVFAGTSPHGGVVAVVGDDPAAKSSTLPSSSDATMVDLHMPIIFPGDVQEALDLARHSVALSRASGVWVGYKLVTSVADGTGTVDVHPDRVVPVVPTIEVDGTPFVPTSERPPAHAVHARHGARVPGGPLGARPPVRRAQQAQPRSPSAPRTTGSASPRPATRTTSCARRCACSGSRRRVAAPPRHPPDAAVDAGAARRRAGAPVRPRARARCSSSRRRTRRSRCSSRARCTRGTERPGSRVRSGAATTRMAQPLIPGTGAIDADKLLAPLRARLVRRIDESPGRAAAGA